MEPYVDLKAVAEYLGSSERHVRNLVQMRKLPHYKVGRLLRFKLSEVERFVQASKVETNQPQPDTPRRRRRIIQP